jgi:hypothetical protein
MPGHQSQTPDPKFSADYAFLQLQSLCVPKNVVALDLMMESPSVGRDVYRAMLVFEAIRLALLVDQATWSAENAALGH